jgi:DNA-binding NarL/FixJ family response regulator
MSLGSVPDKDDERLHLLHAALKETVDNFEESGEEEVPNNGEIVNLGTIDTHEYTYALIRIRRLDLTERQVQIVQQVGDGCENKEIAKSDSAQLN